jgi:hypothetical protein
VFGGTVTVELKLDDAVLETGAVLGLVVKGSGELGLELIRVISNSTAGVTATHLFKPSSTFARCALKHEVLDMADSVVGGGLDWGGGVKGRGRHG